MSISDEFVNAGDCETIIRSDDHGSEALSIRGEDPVRYKSFRQSKIIGTEVFIRVACQTDQIRSQVISVQVTYQLLPNHLANTVL